MKETIKETLAGLLAIGLIILFFKYVVGYLVTLLLLGMEALNVPADVAFITFFLLVIGPAMIAAAVTR